MNAVEQAKGYLTGEKCAICDWYELCIKPPAMTKAEIDELAQKSNEGENPMAGILTAMVYGGGRDSTCEACEVFRSRLRVGPRLSQAIKQLMREWEEA